MGVCVARTASCAVSYNSQYGTPVTIRNAIGDMIQCRKQIGTCPTTAVLDTDGVNSVFSTFPMFNSAGQIASCYPPAAVGSTCTISIDNSTYSVPIRSNGTLKGCLASGSTKCPTDFPFTVISNGFVVSCAAAGDQTSCASPSIPLTQGVGPVGAGSFILVGCLNSTTCPAAYPTTIALGINGPALECMVPGSVCYRGSQPFSLFEERTDSNNNKYLELTWCINPQQSITDCRDANPSTQFNSSLWSEAAEVYNNVGTSILGCIRRPINNVPTSLRTCPVEYPFLFKEASGATFQCRAGIDPATTCAGAVAGATAPPTIGKYNVDVKDLNANLIGCTETGGTTCPTDGVIVSATANSDSELCLNGNITSCAGVTNPNGADRSFPIYSGVKSDGTAKLVRCIAPFTATDCSGNAVNETGADTYTVPMYSNADGTGQVIGCVRTTGQNATSTPCPGTAPFYLLDNGAASPLKACIQNRPACNITTIAWQSYGIPLTRSNNTGLLGCMASSSTVCPSSAAGSPYTVDFAIRNPDNSLLRCEQQSPNAVLTCTNFVPAGMVPIINSNQTGAVAPVIGCQIINATGGIGTYPNSCANGYIALYAYSPNLNTTKPALVGCVLPTTTVCSEPYEVRVTNGPGGVLQGCWNGNNARRRSRSLLADGMLTVATFNEGELNGCPLRTELALWGTRRDSPYECRNLPNNTPTSCTNTTNLILTGDLVDFTTGLFYKAANTTTLVGCQVSTINTCPRPTQSTAYQYFIATITGTLKSCSEQFSCPNGTVPVFGTTNVTLSQPPIGCVDPNANNTQNPCPTWNNTQYTFFTADASGAVTGCFKNNANITCNPGQILVQQGASGNTVGCLPGGLSQCPNSVAGAPHNIEFWASSGTNDATPVLARCASGSFNASTCPTDFKVPLLTGNLSTSSFSTAPADGCVQSGTDPARCPSSHSYTRIAGATSAIEACYTAYAGSCNTGNNAPLCTASVQQGTAGGLRCTTANTQGCIVGVPNLPASNTSTMTAAINQCYKTVPRQYPTVSPFGTWVANIPSTGTEITDLIGCYTATVCDNSNVTSTFSVAVRIAVGSVLQGCVDETVPPCSTLLNTTLLNQPSWQCSQQLR